MTQVILKKLTIYRVYVEVYTFLRNYIYRVYANFEYIFEQILDILTVLCQVYFGGPRNVGPRK